MKNQPDNTNKSSSREKKRDVYTSYNALAGRAEVKSVSQSMHEFIKEGFAKFHAANG
jgi:hypothetical protein